jgi:hypothetical protein
MGTALGAEGSGSHARKPFPILSLPKQPLLEGRLETVDTPQKRFGIPDNWLHKSGRPIIHFAVDPVCDAR